LEFINCRSCGYAHWQSIILKTLVLQGKCCCRDTSVFHFQLEYDRDVLELFMPTAAGIRRVCAGTCTSGVYCHLAVAKYEALRDRAMKYALS